MVNVTHAPADGLSHLRKRGPRMSGVRADSLVAAGERKFARSSDFRCDCGRHDVVGILQVLVEFLLDGRPHRRAGVSAARFVPEVRAVKVSPHDARRVRRRRHAELTRQLQRGDDLLMSRHRGGDCHPRRAVTHVGLEGKPERFGGPVHEVSARAAVHMQIDKARRDVSVAGVDHRGIGRDGVAGREHFGDAAVAHNQRAGCNPVRQHNLSAKRSQHGVEGAKEQRNKGAEGERPSGLCISRLSILALFFPFVPLNLCPSLSRQHFRLRRRNNSRGAHDLFDRGDRVRGRSVVAGTMTPRDGERSPAPFVLAIPDADVGAMF